MLTKDMVRRVVETVAADPVCRAKINRSHLAPIAQHLPASLPGATGWSQNMSMSITEWWNGTPADPNLLAGSKEMVGRLCVGIAASVCDVFVRLNIQKRWLPGFTTLAGQQIPTNSGTHTANQFTTEDGGEYVIDWWMNLDLRNPLVWRMEHWVRYPFTGPFGIPYQEFTGFT